MTTNARRYVVTTAHVSTYPDAIHFRAGTRLDIGQNDDEFPSFVWVTTPDGNSGWAPEDAIERTSDGGVARYDYSAHELNTEVGELLDVLRTYCGWVEVTNSRAERGWVPESTIAPA